MFIPFSIHSGQYNMSYDEELLNQAEKENIDLILRFYAWEVPTISLGRNQKILGINEKFCEDNNIPIVRRITGGRALLHDKELTYSIICSKKILKDGNNVINDYKELTGTILKALKLCNINADYGEKTKSNIGAGYCMNLSTICDINFEGKKFIGSAQFRGNTHILQHGSIPIEFNEYYLENIFNGEVDFNHITTLNAIRKNFNINEFMEKMKIYYDRNFFRFSKIYFTQKKKRF